MRRQSTGTKQISRLSRGALGLALALLVGSSFGAQAASAQEVESEQSRAEAIEYDGTVEVQVRNNGWNDVRVYALRDGHRYRLGTVTALTSAVLRIPKHLQPNSFGVQLLALPIGARARHVSPIIYVSEGERLLWSLEFNLDLSYLVRVS